MEITNKTNIQVMKPGTPVDVRRIQVANNSETNVAKPMERIDEKEVKPALVSVPEEKAPEKVEPRDNREFADMLAEKAKQNGVDRTFELLASSKFQDRKPEEATKREDKPKIEKPLPKEEAEKDANELSMASQLEALQNKVNTLASENEQLKKQVENLNEANKKALMTTYELALILKKMIEKEEDEKKRQTWLEMLVKLMGKMLVAMMVGPDEAEKMDHNKPRVVEKIAA